MALDQNLFTLQLVRLTAESSSNIDLVDPSNSSVHYRKRKLVGSHSFGVYEPLSDSLLSAVAASSNSKAKVIELYNPDTTIQLKYTGTLSFKWLFPWEDHTFEWRREQCFLIRKPDPPVLVAITKEPPGKIRSTLVQILDYNLTRFDITDRKGLEILILTALLSFQDDDSLSTSPSPPIPPPKPAKLNAAQNVAPSQTPSKPPEKSAEDEIAILQAAEAKEANEIVVGDAGDAARYAGMCIKLLKDSNILFVAIRSSTASAVPKVVAVADLTKRLAHRDDSFVDELHQYLTYQEEKEDGAKKKQKRVIKLDDSAEASIKPKQDVYMPPENLIIRLSKIPMPELVPKAKLASMTTPDPSPVAITKSYSSIGFFGRFWKDDPSKPRTSAEQLAPPPPSIPPRPQSVGPSYATKPPLRDVRNQIPYVDTKPQNKLSKSTKDSPTSPRHSSTAGAPYIALSNNFSPPPSTQIAPIPVQFSPPLAVSPSPSWGTPPEPPAPHGRPGGGQQQALSPSLTSLLGTAALQMWQNRKR